MAALLLITFILFGFVIAGFMGAPWVPTLKRDVTSMLNDVKLNNGELFIELGCGDGRLVSAAAKRGARAIGYEINPLLWLIAAVRNLQHYPKAKIYLGNFWPRDISKADVVMTFLMPKFMNKLENKTNAEMKAGSRLISYIFKLPTKKQSKQGAHWTIYSY